MHRHAFFRTARTTQAALTCGADIEHLADLARTYWAILSRPTLIEGRADFLACDLDTNGDGRIRMPEVLEAIEWLKPRIASFDRLFLPYEGLVKEDFRDDTPKGKALSDLLAQIAPDGKPVTDKAIREYHTKFYFIDVDRDGDASIEVEALDSKLKPYAELVWKVVGPANQTLAEEHLPLFYDLFKQWRQWQADKPKGRFTLEDVQSRWPLRKKIDDYFRLCDERAYDAATPLAHDPSKPLKDAPISLAGDATQLSLAEGVNPEWADQTAELAKILGTTTLTRDLWESLKREWDPYDVWWKKVPKELYYFLPFTEADFALIDDPAQRAALEAVFQKAKLLYSPGKASNAGGVATSGLEMTQNSIRLKWSAEEVDAKLHDIMTKIHAVCVEYGTEPDGYINYVKGANIAGFMTVADAMLAQGIV